MKKINKWIKKRWSLLKSLKQTRLVFLCLAVVFTLATVLIAGVTMKKYDQQIPTSVEESENGKVEGVSDNALPEASPTPTIVKTFRAAPIITLTPTTAPTSSGSQQSNNNQPNNASNNSNQASSPTLIPTSTPTPTQEPTPTPTPDNSSFEAEWNVNWSGDSVSVTITANKPLQSCEGDIKVTSGTTVVGNTTVNDNVCTFGGGTSKCFATVWAKITSTGGETKEFSQLRSNTDPCL